MENLYQNVSQSCSKLVTTSYSTSFTIGIRLFEKKYRNPIFSIYGFVRLADEIVDTFYEQDQERLLDEFEEDTFAALRQRFSLNPILHSFQTVVHQYGIDESLIRAFLKSMRMDLTKRAYDRSSYDEYVYGSAEVIGLMCLRVFLNGDAKQYDALAGYARTLGSVFQKVNFLRDMQSDYKDRSRVYFPEVNFEKFCDECKKVIEREIEVEFEEALEGIRRLPKGVKLGVYTAFIYYRHLFKKIQRATARELLLARIRVNNPLKFYLMTKSTIKIKFNLV